VSVPLALLLKTIFSTYVIISPLCISGAWKIGILVIILQESGSWISAKNEYLRNLTGFLSMKPT